MQCRSSERRAPSPVCRRSALNHSVSLGRLGLSRPRTRSIPEKTSSSMVCGRCPVRSVSSSRSTVMSCETFATESLGNPVSRARRIRFPGAEARRRLLVRGTTTTVAIRLRLKALPWTTRTGRRNPGAEPVGSGRSAQTTSPCAITTRLFAGRARRSRGPTGLTWTRPSRRAHRGQLSPTADRAAKRIRAALRYKAGFSTS